MRLSSDSMGAAVAPSGRFGRIAPLLALAFALACAGCSSNSLGNLIDSLPRGVGLPADAPERPAEPAEYPAVHDMPPPRPNTTLTAEEQVQLEKELTATRNRQDTIAGTAPATSRKPRPAAQPATPRVIPASSSNSIY